MNRLQDQVTELYNCKTKGICIIINIPIKHALQDAPIQSPLKGLG